MFLQKDVPSQCHLLNTCYVPRTAFGVYTYHSILTKTLGDRNCHPYFYFLIFYYWGGERECVCVHTRVNGEWGIEGEGERESQAGSMPSAEPNVVLNPMIVRS